MSKSAINSIVTIIGGVAILLLIDIYLQWGSQPDLTEMQIFLNNRGKIAVFLFLFVIAKYLVIRRGKI